MRHGVALVAALVLGSTAQSMATQGTPDLEALAAEAFVYAFPLYEFCRTRNAALQNQAPNRIGHRRTLARATTRGVTTPNNDTLYSSAWLDLRAGPVAISVPDTAGRYYSIALMDAYTNNFAYIGRRTTGTAAGTFVVIGPAGTPPAGVAPTAVIRAPTNSVWALARWLVDGPDDIEAVARLQDATRLESAARAAPQEYPLLPMAPDSATFFGVINRAMTENPPPQRDQALLQRMAQMRVGPGQHFDWDALGAEAQEGVARGVARAQRDLRSGGLAAGGARGWSSPQGPIGNFGTDYLLRGRIALSGLAALEPVEAHYASARTDGDGGLLEGSNRYVLRFEPGAMPPVDGFWSLTLYEIAPDGRLFFVDHPLQRYAVGDRSPTLRRGADGSLEIYISALPPGGERDANWLPAAPGPFVVTMRAYQPRPEVLDGRYVYPQLRRLD